MTLEAMASEVRKPLGLGEQVAKIIRKAILQGALHSGQRLIVSQIASELGISRTPVRDALQRLETDRLVTMLPSGAVVVTELSLDDLEDITAVRELVEPYATRLAASRIAPQALAELEELHANMFKAAEEADLPEYIKLNDSFHSKVFEASGSPTLQNLIRSLNFALYFRQVASFFGPSHLMPRWREHEPILDAIRQGQEEVAEQASRYHIGQTLQLIRQEKGRTAQLSL